MKKWLCLLIVCIIPLFADLEEYVSKKEASYKWQQLSQDKNVYKLSLVSQVWKDIRWYHPFYAVLPEDTSKAKPALLWITGSGNGETEIKYAQKIVAESNCPVFILMAVPNQPLFDGLWEDALISYTFKKYLEEKDSDWILLFPMVKSAVQAMNVASEFYQKKFNTPISDFVVTGASKRGWTTWLTSCVDKRVKAIVPIVFDNLNFSAQMKNQIDMWGKYSEEIGDYTEKKLQEKLEEPEGKMLVNLVDPYSYRNKITVPKFMVIGTNDQYWPLNAVDMYYDNLPDDKYIVYVPNNGHRITTTSYIENALVAALQFSQNKAELPNFSWDFSEDQKQIKISFQASKNIKQIKIWRSDSPNTDFREAYWKSFDVARFVKSINVPLPRNGKRAVYVEGIFDYQGKDLSITSNVYIAK